MKHLRHLLLLLACTVLAGTLQAQTKAVTVTVADSALATPADFFTANKALISTATASIPRDPYTVLAGPSSGVTAEAPTWRRLAASDITAAGFGGMVLDGTTVQAVLQSADEALDALYVDLALRQPLDAELTALASVTSAADLVPYFTGSGTAGTTTLTSYARTLLDDANAAAARSTLGLATVASSGSASDLSTGTLPAARLPTSGVTAGSGYNQVTVDTYGRVTSAAIASYITDSRTINTLAPLTGGGDLSANRTLAISTASDAAVGAVELATVAEVITGTASGLAITPAGDRAALTAYVDPIAATRAPLANLYYNDGSTSLRRFSVEMGVAGNAAGTAFSHIGCFYRVPATDPATNAVIWQYSDVAVNSASTVSGMLGLWHGTDGSLQMRRGTDSSNRDAYVIAGWRAANAGKLVRLDFVSAANTATFPTIYQDGVALTGWALNSTAGTPPNWQAPATGMGFFISGAGAPAGEFVPGTPINRALTAGEVATMVQTNALLPVDRLGGSMVATSAGSFTLYRRYRITTVGTTDFTLIGAANSLVGTEFTASGVGSGTGTAVPIGALLQPQPTGTAIPMDVGPNRIHGLATAGIRPLHDAPLAPIELTVTTTGAFLTGASTNPLVYGSTTIYRAEIMVDTAGADVTLRRQSSSTNDIVTAATDVPTANIWTNLTLADAQRTLAAGETVWGLISTGTARLRLFPVRSF